MSKFDDIFKHKLEEESHFPNANKNWKAMSKRLDAFHLGASAWQQTAVWWKAAAISAAVISASLGWKMHDILKKNTALEAQVAQMSQILIPPSVDKSVVKSTNQTPVGNELGSKSEFQTRKSDTDHPSVAEPSVTASPAPQEVVKKTTKPALKPEALKNEAAKIRETQQANLINNMADSLLAYRSVMDSLQQKIMALTATLTEQSAIDLKGKDTATMATSPSDPDMAIKAQVDHFLAEATIAQSEIPVPAIQPPAPVTEPFKQKTDRFLVGVGANKIQFSPAQKNISKGKTYGLHADYRVWNNAWVYGNVEHTQVDINSGNIPSGFQLPELPHSSTGPNPWPGPKPNHKLINVASELDFSQFGLGIRYRLPLPIPLRPVFSIGHQWVRSAENMVSFMFDEPGPKHEEEVFIKNTNITTQGNNWRYGIALEYPIKSISLRATADYQQFNKNKPLMPNAWNVGAGVAIRLF